MRIGQCQLETFRPVLAAALVSVLAGCASLGPARVGIDRNDYAARLRESEKEQLLTNIVALRHGDAPLFLNVTSVISQYTRESSGRLQFAIDVAPDNDGGIAAGGVLLRETPTVTYAPLSGERFSRNLLAPMPPAALLSMMEAGWAADLLLRLAARSLNGISNDSRAPLFERDADAEFEPVVAAFRRLQRSDAMSIRVRQREQEFSASVRLRPELSAQEQQDLDFLSQRLGLERRPGSELSIVFANHARTSSELAIATRSMFEVLEELSQCVELQDAGTAPPRPLNAPLMRIHSGDRAPGAAHVSVQYRGRWFWIDQDDAASKQMFLLAQVMMSLTDSGSGSAAPLVTLPAG